MRRGFNNCIDKPGAGSAPISENKDIGITIGIVELFISMSKPAVKEEAIVCIESSISTILQCKRLFDAVIE